MMTLVSLDGSRRKLVSAVIAQVLTPCQITMAHQLIEAEHPGMVVMPEDLLFWLRLNMPVAAESIDAILHPED
jgi:hypothetical protein